MSNYLVTGGAGFIGSHIVERLIKEGHSVRVLDDFSSGDLKNLSEVSDYVEIYNGDIRDARIVAKAMDGVEYVFHEAGISSIQASIKNPLITQEINLAGTVNILENAVRSNVKRVIFASSAACYGDSELIPKNENMVPDPLSPYALHKIAGESYQKIFSKLYGIETVALRYFNVYGSRQNPDSPYSGVISIFHDRMLKNISPVIYGNGEQTRDFVYVGDVVNANILAALSEKVGHGEVINIATGTEVSMNKLFEILKEILNSKLIPKYAEQRAGDIIRSVADISKAIDLLGYNPTFGLQDGLRILINK